MENLQSQLESKQAELAALEDTPENAEARAQVQSEIESLEAQIVALEAQLALEALQSRIEALGDIALLIDSLFKARPSDLRPSDSWNPCAFCAAHMETPFGWNFEILSKPTLAELENIKQSLDAQ